MKKPLSMGYGNVLLEAKYNQFTAQKNTARKPQINTNIGRLTMSEKRSIREMFNHRGKSMIETSSNPSRMALAATFGLIVLPFSHSIGFAVFAGPSVGCALGYALQFVSKIGNPKP